MDNLIETIQKILNIPSDYEIGDKSPLTLVKESGYIEMYNQIEIESLLSILILQPKYIADWLQWSDDKGSPGWVFRKADNGEFSISDHSENGDWKDIWFTDGFLACANYIKKEIEAIRTNSVQ